MKTETVQLIIIGILGFTVGFMGSNCYRNHTPTVPRTTSTGTMLEATEVRRTEAPTFDDLLDAIEWVESKGDANAIGDNGRAVGAYQIYPCYVEDVRWGYGHRGRFEDDDRLSKKKSRVMVRCYLSQYATYYKLGRYPTLEDFARIHNGGPNGWKKDSTEPYWQKVKARIDHVQSLIKGERK